MIEGGRGERGERERGSGERETERGRERGERERGTFCVPVYVAFPISITFLPLFPFTSWP